MKPTRQLPDWGSELLTRVSVCPVLVSIVHPIRQHDRCRQEVSSITSQGTCVAALDVLLIEKRNKPVIIIVQLRPNAHLRPPHPSSSIIDNGLVIHHQFHWFGARS